MYSGGTVCNDGLQADIGDDKTAEWICRMMGYESLDYWANGLKYTWQESYPIKLDDTQCSGSVVPQCSYLTSHNCQHYEDVWLSCNIRKQRGGLNSFYLLDNTEMFTQSGHGLLMYQGGTVCDDGFNDQTAKWICRLMGYGTLVNWSQGLHAQFQNNLPINVDNLVCSNGVYTDILPSCSFDMLTSEDDHNEDVWLSCSSPIIPECPAGYKVRRDNMLCEECPSSTYSPAPNVNVCLPCPVNSSSSVASTHCTCIGGTYMTARLDNCEKCEKGTVSREGGMDSDRCVACQGYSVPIDHGKGCSCQKGHGWFWTSDTKGTCSPCSVNFYKHKIKGICTQCPPEATSFYLSEACICAIGSSWDGEHCVDCDKEKSKDGVCGCRAGTFWDAYSNTCEECPQNHYSKDYSVSCTMCPLFTVSSSKSAECHSCPNGQSWEDYACFECPNLHIGNGAYCVKCPEGSSPSSEKTMCQKSNSIDILSVASLILSLMVIVLILSLVIWSKITSRNVSNLKLSYSPDPCGRTSPPDPCGTVQLSGRKCMCPDCPCSARPALPPRDSVIQDDDLYMNHAYR